MSIDFNANLTIQADPTVIREIVSEYHNAKTLEAIALPLQILEVFEHYVYFHYEWGNDGAEEILHGSRFFPDAIFTIDYDSNPDNLSGRIIIINGEVTFCLEIPIEICLKLRLKDVCDLPEYFDSQQAVKRQEHLPADISSAIDTLLRDNIWDKPGNSILNLLDYVSEAEDNCR
jgi:hypothetical protein